MYGAEAKKLRSESENCDEDHLKRNIMNVCTFMVLNLRCFLYEFINDFFKGPDFF